MAWLVNHDAHVLASAEVADTHATRRRGLLGRDGVNGALVLRPCRWVHTTRMRFDLDVAYLDESGTVLKIARMRPNRVGLPVRKASCVIEAEAGAFARWGVQPGDVIEVRDGDA